MAPLTFKEEEEQKSALKPFLSGKDVFARLPTGFGKSFLTAAMTYV